MYEETTNYFKQGRGERVNKQYVNGFNKGVERMCISGISFALLRFFFFSFSSFFGLACNVFFHTKMNSNNYPPGEKKKREMFHFYS